VAKHPQRKKSENTFERRGYQTLVNQYSIEPVNFRKQGEENNQILMSRKAY
jgi:hypothetical protein